MFPWMNDATNPLKKMNTEGQRGSNSGQQLKKGNEFIPKQGRGQYAEKTQIQYQDNLAQNIINKSQSEKVSGKKIIAYQQGSNQKSEIIIGSEYKRQLEKAKQEYQDFYRKNVSEFNKKQEGYEINYNEEKKRQLQEKYQGEEEEKANQVFRIPQSRRQMKTPVLSREDYGESLRQQIEEKREIIRLQKRKQEKEDFQNKYEDGGFLFNSINQETKRPKSILVPQNNQSDEKILYIQRDNNNQQHSFDQKKYSNKKNVGFEDVKSQENDEGYHLKSQENDEGYHKYEQIDIPKEFHREQGKYQEDNSKQFQREEKRNSQEYQKHDNFEKNREVFMSEEQMERQKQKEDTIKYLEEKAQRAKNLQRVVLPNARGEEQNQKKGIPEKKKFENKENSPAQKEQDVIEQLYEREERDKKIKKVKEDQYYKELVEGAQDKDERRGRRGESSQSRDFSWSKNDKSMLDVLGENFEKKEEKKEAQKSDMAEQLTKQIKEKKQKMREQKEKEQQLDRQYEEKVKSQLKELKYKYDKEMQGKQQEIKNLKKSHDKKRKESNLKKSESFMSSMTPKSSDRHKSTEIYPQPSPQQHYESMTVPEEPADEEMDKTLYNKSTKDQQKQEWKVTKRSSNENILAPVKVIEAPLKDQQEENKFQRKKTEEFNADEQQEKGMDNALEKLKEEVFARKQGDVSYNQGNGYYQNEQQQYQMIENEANMQQQYKQNYYFDHTTNSNTFQNNSAFYSPPTHLNSGIYFNNQEHNKSAFFSKDPLNRSSNQEWNPPPLWVVRDRKNEEELMALKDSLSFQTNLLKNGSQRIKQEAQIASQMKSTALFDLENLKDQLKRQSQMESVKLKELKNNLGGLSSVQNDVFLIASAPRSYGGMILGNSKSPLSNSFNINNQSLFSASHLNSSFNTNNKPSLKKQSNNDILDKLISQSGNAYRFEGNISNNPTALDLKLQNRLTKVHLGKVDIQLLEVDNLLNNLKSGI